MKRFLLLILFAAATLAGCAQTVVQRSGAANTVNDPRHMASFNSFQPRYADTSAANLERGIDSSAAIIYTYDVKGFWYRQHAPKKWVRMGESTAQAVTTVTNVTLLTDNSVQICTGINSSCDTLTFVSTVINGSRVYLLSDTEMVVCDSLNNCDTVSLGASAPGSVYVFQNGLTHNAGVTEWGGTLLHPTVIDGTAAAGEASVRSPLTLQNLDALEITAYGQVQTRRFNGSDVYGHLFGDRGHWLYTNGLSGASNLYIQDSAIVLNNTAGKYYLYNAPSSTDTATRSLVLDPITRRLYYRNTNMSADNGLTTETATNVKLGGTLKELTTIFAGSAYKLSVTGSSTNPNYLLNLAGGTAGLYASGSNLAAQFASTNTSTSAYARTLVVQRSGPVGALAGFGSKIDMEALNASGSNKLAGSFGFRWTNPAAGTETARMEWALMNGGATEARKMALAGSGKLTLDTYGDGLHTGTPTYQLATDVDGNVIEIPASSGSGIVTADNGLTASGTNVQLGGTLIKNTSIVADTYQLTVSSSLSNIPMNVTANTGTALNVSSNSGLGIITYSATGSGIQAASDGDTYAAILRVNSTANNTVTSALQLMKSTSTGPAANGHGVGIDFTLMTTNYATVRSAGKIDMKWTNAADATRTSEFEITGVNNATAISLLTISGAGIFTLVQGLPEYADNSAAWAGGLSAGQLYRTGDVVKIVHGLAP